MYLEVLAIIFKVSTLWNGEMLSIAPNTHLDVEFQNEGVIMNQPFYKHIGSPIAVTSPQSGDDSLADVEAVAKVKSLQPINGPVTLAADTFADADMDEFWPDDFPSNQSEHELILAHERREQDELICHLSILKPLFKNHMLAMCRTRVINLNTDLTYGAYTVYLHALSEAGFEMVVLPRSQALWPHSLTDKNVPLLLSPRPEDLQAAIDRYELPLYLWSSPNLFNEYGVCEIVMNADFMAHHRLCEDWFAMAGIGANPLTLAQCEWFLQLPFNERELALLAAAQFWGCNHVMPEDFSVFSPEDQYLPVGGAADFILDLQSIAESLFKTWHRMNLGTLRVGYDTHVGHAEISTPTHPAQTISMCYEIFPLEHGEFLLQFKTAPYWANSDLYQLAYLCNEANRMGDGGCHCYEIQAQHLAITSLYTLQLRQVCSSTELDQRLQQTCTNYLKFFHRIVARN